MLEGRTLFSASMESLQVDKISEELSNLARVDIMLVILVISSAIHILFLKSGLITVPNIII